jgi:hypothetical protein
MPAVTLMDDFEGAITANGEGGWGRARVGR